MYLEFNGRKANLRSHQFSALSLTSFLLSFFSRFFSKFSAIALFVVFIVNVGWGQTTIASDGLNNSTTLFTLSGGSYYTGTTSSTADAPAFSAYAVEGTHSRGIANGTATLTSSNINTTGYSSIQMTFRLASYSVGSTSNGADGGDIVTVEVSPNGGTNYYSTVRVLGNSNARWSWSSGTGNASTAYDGNASSVDFTSGAGNATTTGYSAVTITSLPVTSNMRIRVTLLNDNGNERWLLDDFKVTGTASTFSVTYNANSASSGSVPSDATAYSSGSSVNTAANSGSLARTGYTFAGWNTAADGTGTTYAVSTSSAFTISSNTTLYARWTAAVTYDANGATSGSVPTDATAYRPGQAVTTSANSGTLARTGYTFAGWNTAADGMGTTYAVGTSSAFNISGNTTLYARWTASLTYDANSATSGSVPTDATAYRPGQAVSTASNSGSLARAGYSFAGWNTLADGTGTAYSVSTSNAFNISGNTTLYAQWTLISSPTIATSGTLSAVNTTYGTASASPTSFSVSGSALTNDITIMPPSGYEISTSLASGYENSLTLVQSGGSISSTTIYVRLAAITAVGSYSGNISLTSTGATTQNVATVSSVVSSKALNITGLTASNKVYDATTTASLTGTAAYGGLVNGESFSVSGTPTASFATKTVGTGKAVTVTGYTAPSANYTVTQPTGLTATITAKTVTITSAAVSNKTYDGTTSATISGTLSGVIAGDVVTLNGTGTFASANVGTGIVVTSSATLSGADAANYTLTQPTGIAANITSKSLTITANDVAKQYGSTLTGSSGSTAFTSSGLVVPETIGSVTISYGSGSAPGDAVGAYLGQVTPSAATSGTFNASNYTITYVSGTINVSLYAVGDFRTKQNGNWGTTSTWEKWNESAWVASTNVPDVSTANVLVLHTVDVNGSGTPPWNVNNLTVQSGGKLWCNSFTGNNDYIQVYGDILCDGTIGSIAGDDISFDIAGGNDCNISGTGSFTASRLRKDSDINTGQNSNVTIDMDVRLTWSSASGTVLYNNSGASSDFNVTINTGKNLRCSGPGSIACNVSIDGVDGTGSGNRGGTYTVHGTLDIDGALYSLNNNTSASARTTNAIVKSGGLIKCRYIETGTSGAAGNTLRIENGGKLMIFGSVDTITATLNDITWNGYSATNNTWDFQSGSTIEYSGATQQRLNGITTCSNFIVSGGGLKKLGNDFTVAGMLTLTSGRVQTDAYELIHSSTAASDLTHTTGSASFIYGIYRRYISSNTSTYELPVGLSSATS
ncbi:MAG: beta strand repeat-containing protein, partial [Flavobacteriia bacterium]